MDESGNLSAGIKLCPPEGDAGTGMVATNSVAPRTGNVSAGTSTFAMIVLEKQLGRLYREIDMVTTPTGFPCAMSHANNGTSDLNAWVNLFGEFAYLMGIQTSQGELFEKLYRKSLEGDADCDGLLAYGYYSGENITMLNEGRLTFLRTADSKLNLANFMRVHLYTSLGAVKMGLDILMKGDKRCACIYKNGMRNDWNSNCYDDYYPVSKIFWCGERGKRLFYYDGNLRGCSNVHFLRNICIYERSCALYSY